MSVSLEVVSEKYLANKTLSSGTCKEYRSTVRKWLRWNQRINVDEIDRAALREFFNYGVDTGTVFKSAAFHEPILWRHVDWRPEPPNGQGRESRYGWIYYRRVKTKKQFFRPMNRVDTGTSQEPGVGRS